MLVFDRDILSPFVNVGFVGLALLAGWCVGRPFAVAPVTLMGVALVVASPILVWMEAGTAKNDVVGLAFLLSSVALVVNAGKSRPAMALAAISAGLALGTKLTFLAPVAGLMIAALVAADRSARRSIALIWAGGLFAGGGFWYVRNLAHTGNPLPWLDLGLGPVSLPSLELPLTELYRYPIAHYVTDSEFWSVYYIPGIKLAFGPLWFVLPALAAAGMVLSAIRGDRLLFRLLGIVGIVSVVAYVFTPSSAGGPLYGPSLVYWTFRYVTPALAIGLVLLPLVPALRAGRRRTWMLATYGIALLVTLVTSDAWENDYFSATRVRALAGIAFIALLAAGAVMTLRRRPFPRPVLAASVAAVSAVGIAVGWKAQQVYLDGRYETPGARHAKTWQWARDLKDARIAISGLFLQYPLYGSDLSNRVQYLGHRGPHGNFSPARDCGEWRRLINAGRYGYVATAPLMYPWYAKPARETAEAHWTRSDPAAREIQRDGKVSVFRIDGHLDPERCPRRAYGDRVEQAVAEVKRGAVGPDGTQEAP
jgi:hypothetical protein